MKSAESEISLFSPAASGWKLTCCETDCIPASSKAVFRFLTVMLSNAKPSKPVSDDTSEGPTEPVSPLLKRNLRSMTSPAYGVRSIDSTVLVKLSSDPPSV